METAIPNKISILDLPDEIIILILNSSAFKDIVSFGLTCKQFCNIVFNDQYLWKSKYIDMFPSSIFKTVQTHSNGNWFNELKKYVELKNNIMKQLLAMSPKFYWRMNPLTLEDVKEFFILATTNELSYYYTIHILQEVIEKAKKNLDKNISQKPYTLTEIHYAKIIIRYLMHTFLSIKWVKLHKRDLMPEVVLNFCVQWIDPANFYSDEKTNEVLNEVVEDVKDAIRQARAKKPPPPGRKKVTDREVLSALTQVLYKQKRITITPAADLDTLNIIKMLNNKCGHAITLAVIYQAVARKCGVKIELIAFPNHLFLEWFDDTNDHNSNYYTISLETGELKPKRNCPFTQRGQSGLSNNLYCPDSLLQFIYSSYLITMGSIRNWNTQNALHLLNFLGTSPNYHNPYKDFYTYLMEVHNVYSPDKSLDIRYVSHHYRQIIIALSTLNRGTEPVYSKFVYKKHQNDVQYAVGMICCHVRYEFVCVIRGWDLSGEHVDIPADNLFLGRKQPFYRVTAVDQSERYVAQENLTPVETPHRLYHLEDQISKEFSHFDGFVYVLNDEKRIEYPNETPIIEMYRSRAVFD